MPLRHPLAFPSASLGLLAIPFAFPVELWRFLGLVSPSLAFPPPLRSRSTGWPCLLDAMTAPSATYTYLEIASDYILWEMYADPDGIETRESFDACPVQERLDFLVRCFGAEVVS